MHRASSQKIKAESQATVEQSGQSPTEAKLYLICAMTALCFVQIRNSSDENRTLRLGETVGVY